MDIYYLNLDSQPERRRAIERQLAQIGVSGIRVRSRTPEEAATDRRAQRRRIRRFAPLTGREVACAVTHLVALEQFLATEAPYAVILEDDALLSEKLPAFLSAFERSGSDVGLVKLDAIPDVLRIGVNIRGQIAGTNLVTPISRVVCTTGYLIGRRAAKIVLAWPGIIEHPIDEMLYWRENRLANRLDYACAEPALCAPTRTVTGFDDSTIHPERLLRHEAGIGLFGQLRAAHSWYRENITYGLSKTIFELRQGGRSEKRRISIAEDITVRWTTAGSSRSQL